MNPSILHAFAQAEQYAEQAEVQRQVAERLAARLCLPMAKPHMLEWGCGTGFLSRLLQQRWPQGRLLCSDLAWPMVQRCRTVCGATANIGYLVADGQQPPFATAAFDLIAASMVMQWFTEPLLTLRQWHDLLRPGGRVAFATLAPGTFHEWRGTCQALGLPHGIADYPLADGWFNAWPSDGERQLQEERITVHHPSGLAFLQHLRAVGAHLPAPGYHPLSAGGLRRILRSLTSREGMQVTYVIYYGIFVKGE
ncbi:MAG: methyltransferase domain-containing protein [Magnetococcales bacterium]|nr:methyltransferase domain-containing protein [Magnetococcales bacterium]